MFIKVQNYCSDLIVCSHIESEENENSQPVSPAPEPSGVRQPVAKKRKVNKLDDPNTFILKNVPDIQERRSSKAEVADSEAHFGSHVAATLRRLEPRQRAMAKLQIDQVLLNAEFPCEPNFHASNFTMYNS